jgi:hypothetical protein
VLTPLPGSQDHKELFDAGIEMDSDMNNYDLHHVTTAHANMSADEWREAFQLAWTSYYSPEHILTLLRRARASGIKPTRMANMVLWFAGCSTIEGLHPLDGGYFRIKSRLDRRPGLGIEKPHRFYPRYAWEIISKHARYLRLLVPLRLQAWRLERDPEAVKYRDSATSAPKPVAKVEGAKVESAKVELSVAS